MIDCAEINRTLHDHPNITKVAGVKFVEDQKLFCLFLEKGLGSIRDIINPNGDKKREELRDKVYLKKTKRDIVQEALEGLAYVHSKTDKHDNRISHRDFKPENILIFPQERSGSFVVKITDFDSSKSMEDGDKRVAMTTGMCTEVYQDPWLAKRKEKGKPVTSDDYLRHDTYSFGLFFFELLDGTHLYMGASDFETISNMRKNDRDHLMKSNIDELAKNAIWTMTQPDPKQRVTLEQAKRLPCFNNISDHIQALSELNEAIINWGDSSEAQKKMDQLNKTFFMIFAEEKWQNLPFVVPDLLKKSIYSNTLACYIRYKRNLIAHAGQNQAALQKHFGASEPLTGENLFHKVNESRPGSMMHLYWAAKRFFRHLPCVSNIPNECVKAHDDRMKLERERLNINDTDALEKLYQEICPEIESTSQKASKKKTKKCDSKVPSDHQARIDRFLECYHELIQPFLKDTEPDFNSLKTDVKNWEKRRNDILKTIPKMRENGKPEAEIEKKKAELADIEGKLKASWILNFRQELVDPLKHRLGGKSSM